MVAIKKFSPHKTALTLACVMALSSLILIFPMSMMFMALPMMGPNGSTVSPSMPFSMLIIMPVIYLIIGYIMTLIGALIYNVVAKFTGGIQFELVEDTPEE